MAVGFSNTNKPLNPRGNDASPKGYNRASLFSGKALDFDGVNDYVSGSNVCNSLTSLSVSFLFKLDSLGALHILFDERDGSSDGVSAYIESSNKFTFTINGTYSVGQLSLKASEWYFVSATWDGSTIKTYINGIEDSNASYSGSISTATGYKLAQRAYATGIELNGQLSGFKIFNTALTAAQVADLYNNPEKVVPTGVDNTALKLWLPMQEGAGTTAYDGSGNGNHGTISGATYTHGIGAPVAQTAVIDWNKGTNLVPHSAELDQFTSRIAVSISTNQDSISGYDDAFLITPTAISSSHRIIENLTTASAVHSVSFYAKSNGLNKVVIFVNGQNQGVIFNLDTATTQSFTKYNATPATNQTIQDKGNGWYYCGFTLASDTSSSIQIQLYDDATTPDSFWTGDGVNGMYIYGLSFITANNIGPYVPTLATAQTSEVLLPQGLTTGRDITGVNLFENVRKQGALNLDGNSWAEVHDNASTDMTSAVTLEAWVYWDTDGIINKGILGKWQAAEGYLLYKSLASRVNFFINGSSSVYISLTNGWNHIVGTFDGANRKIYINGALEETDADTSTITQAAINVEIGTYGGFGSSAYDQPIAQPRIYNRALTAEEVARNYDAGRTLYQ